MQILTIDDRSELADIGGYFDYENEQVILTKKEDKPRLLYDVANEVKKKAPDQEYDEKCVIFLNLFLECKDDEFNWQQDQAGIALLKFLRMMGVNHHVVLITPYSLEHLINQDAGNYIIASEGVSLIEPKLDSLYDFSEFEGYYDIQTHRQEQDANTEYRLGFANRFAKYLYEWMIKHGWIQEKQQNSTKTAEEKQPVSLHELADNTFDANDLTDYLKSGFELPADERHNWANWWGIIQLCDVHRSAFPDELNFGNDKSYPGNIDESLKSLKNFQLRKIYRTGDDFQDALATERRIQLREDLEFWVNEIVEKEKQKQQLSLKIQETVDSVKKGEEHQQTVLDLQDDIQKLKNELKDYRIEKEDVEKELNRLNRVIKSDDNLDSNHFNEIRLKRSKSTPKILYIDDQADEGWSDIFQIMLYGEKDQPNDIFQSISKINDNIELFYSNKIKPAISNGTGPDLILLDLRLLNEGGTIRDVRNISGAKLLKYIRKDFPGQPIMMTTASNKAWSVKELYKLGLDCYWSKEGIDVSASLSEKDRKNLSAKNYLTFLNNINALSGKNYQHLKKIDYLIGTIEDEVSWWTIGEWKYPNKNQIDQNNELRTLHEVSQITNEQLVKDIINAICYLLHEYLRSYVLKRTIYKNKLQWFYPSLIIQQVGKIVEAIHSFDELYYLYYGPNRKVMEDRKDTLSVDIYELRRKASHISEVNKLGINEVRKTVTLLIRYLTEIPLSKRDTEIRKAE